jgi:predicted nucleic acid-binding protein
VRRAFVDTNLFVYALVKDGDPRHRKAQSFFESLMNDGVEVVISTQVAVEFVSAVRKIKGDSGSLDEALEFIASYECAPTKFPTITLAAALTKAHKLSWFEALIVQAAIDADCEVLYSDDLQHGRKFGELEVVNPLLD